ncbi:MAG: PKD domain-containing protein [Thermoplasmatota archaeon]
MNESRSRGLVVAITAALLLTATAACLQGPSPEANKAPVARIGSPSAGGIYDTGQELTFDGTGSYDPEGKPLSFKWDFGDNTTASGNLTKHSYALPGRYIVTLEVSDGKKRATDRRELEIRQANRPPVPKLRVSNPGPSNEELVEFNASETTDPDSDPLSFRWLFGDGSSAEGVTVTHVFSAVGVYNVTLTVNDTKTQASAVSQVTVHQANRPPVPSVNVSTLVAMLNDPVEFNASGSRDADGDPMQVHWDFGDGGEADGPVVTHAFSSPGNHTVVANVSDGIETSSASVTIKVVPRAAVLLDWNLSDRAYVIKLEADVDPADLSFSVSDDSGARDGSPRVTPVSAREFRLATVVEPVVGRALTVSVEYLGEPAGARTIHLYENTQYPGRDSTAGYSISASMNTSSTTVQEWLNLTGRLELVVRGPRAEQSTEFSRGSLNRTSLEESSTTYTESEVKGWMNTSSEWGVELNTSLELLSWGNMTSYNETGSELMRLYGESVMRTVDGNRTYISQSLSGRQGVFNMTSRLETLGVEDHPNGDGKLFCCLKTRTNTSGEGYVDFGYGMLHLMLFNETISWEVCDERYENSTIYIEYEQNMYSVNDTSGEWSLIREQSRAGQRYEDSNGDGVYNPDPAPIDLDEAFTFHGPVPRELVVGDRIVGVNKYGVRVELEVTEEDARVVGGTEYRVVRLLGTFSSSSGNATGSSESWVVSEGNLTGLSVESTEDKTWMSGGTAEHNTIIIRLEWVRED